MAIAIRSLVLFSVLFSFLPALAIAQIAPVTAPAPAAKISDEQAMEMITRAIGLKASGDARQSVQLLLQVAKSDSRHFGEAAYLLGMQALEMKKYDTAEKTFKRAIQGNYAPAKAKLIETQALLSAVSTQSPGGSQSTDPNEAGIVKQVLAYQTKIEAARAQFTASSDAHKKLATNDYKAQVDSKTRLRAELEATIKLHKDQLALIPDNTGNADLLKIRSTTSLFKGAYEKFYYSIRPFKIGQDSFLYELKLAEGNELVIRRRMNAAKKAGDADAWLADQAKMKTELAVQIALCSRWLTTLDQYKDPEWARDRLSIEAIRIAINSEMTFLDMGMKFWDASRDG